MKLIFLIPLLALVNGENVAVCKASTDCASCSESYIHVFGFKENCRWCVESQTCGGPLSCPFGKPVVQRESFRCPVKFPTTKGKRYTDRLGRSLFAVALSVRDANATECLLNSRPDINHVKTYEVECDQSHNMCSGLLAVSEEAKAIYVAYKGHSLDKQLFTEFVHSLVAQLGAWEKFENGTGVITYFHQAWNRLFIDGGMKKDLMEMKKKFPNYRIWLTGHSLGGSLASMTALHLVVNKLVEPSRVRLVTFGEPRTGNVAFAKAIENNIEFRYRIVKRNDFVTNIPGSLDPNGLMVTNAVFDRQPLFYRFLVHYDNNMEKNDGYKICEMSDDHGCRNLALAADFNDHITYFGIKHDEFLAQRCKKDLLI
ncbi:unnamed protein product, partial [Mesorhabditis belari]|uniref:Fungal lipase-like domain-containing protein n=1 Tax=Mesorhabditis belari TaxID=2138241 RepID=A0AAF3ENX8_9BILA